MQQARVLLIITSVMASNLSNYSPEIQLVSKYHLEYLENMLSIYRDFSFVVHVDSESLYLGGLILSRLLEASNFVATYNADTTSYPDLKRPPGFKFINVVLLRNPWTFEHFLLKFRNVILYDSIIFVLYRDADHYLRSDRKFWEMSFIKLVGNVIILDMDTPKKVTVYNKCYYCEHNKLKLLEDTEKVSTKIPAADLMPYKFDNFGGHFLIVSFLDYFPYMFCIRSERRQLKDQEFNVCTEFEGAEAKLVEELSKELNFTYAFILNKPRNSFNAIMRSLLNRTTDFAIGGISVTYDRFITATYTTNIRFQDINFLYLCRIPFWNQFKMFILPFDPIVWLLIFATSIFTTVCMNKFFNINNQVIGGKFGFRRALRIAMKLVIDQTEPFITKKILKTRWSTILILVVFLFACLEFNVTYKGKLSSIFVRPPHKEPNNAEELIERNYNFVLDTQQQDYFIQILTKRDPVMIEINRSGKLLSEKCELLRYIFLHQSALIDEITELKYNFEYMCKDVFESYDKDKLRITMHPVRSIPHAWILQPAVPFWKSFDILIGKLRNAGFLNKWTQDALGKYRSYIIPYSKRNAPEDTLFNMTTYSSIFFLYAFGNCVAIIAFAIETLIAWKIQYFVTRRSNRIKHLFNAKSTENSITPHY